MEHKKRDIGTIELTQTSESFLKSVLNLSDRILLYGGDMIFVLKKYLNWQIVGKLDTTIPEGEWYIQNLRSFLSLVSLIKTGNSDKVLLTFSIIEDEVRGEFKCITIQAEKKKSKFTYFCDNIMEQSFEDYNATKRMLEVMNGAEVKDEDDETEEVDYESLSQEDKQILEGDRIKRKEEIFKKLKKEGDDLSLNLDDNLRNKLFNPAIDRYINESNNNSKLLAIKYNPEDGMLGGDTVTLMVGDRENIRKDMNVFSIECPVNKMSDKFKKLFADDKDLFLSVEMKNMKFNAGDKLFSLTLNHDKDDVDSFIACTDLDYADKGRSSGDEVFLSYRCALILHKGDENV